MSEQNSQAQKKGKWATFLTLVHGPVKMPWIHDGLATQLNLNTKDMYGVHGMSSVKQAADSVNDCSFICSF